MARDAHNSDIKKEEFQISNEEAMRPSHSLLGKHDPIMKINYV